MASGDDDHVQLDKAKRLFDEALLVCDPFFFCLYFYNRCFLKQTLHYSYKMYM